MSNKTIAVAGIGYVGLSNAILLSQHNKVFAYDVVKEKVEKINNRISPLIDKEIEEYLSTKILDLTGVFSNEEAYANADFVVIATPTNYLVEENKFDTSYVEAVIEEVLRINPDATIVIKSTVPIGYTVSIAEKYPSGKFLFSPEFLREGKALYDNLYPSRIVVGIPNGDERLKIQAEEFAFLLKEGSKKEDVETIIINSTEAEAVKLFSNTYLAMRVAFFNELDNFCIVNSLNTKQIIDAMSLEPRIGRWYNNPSFGYGGYCLPKDTRQMLANFEGIPNDLITAIVKSNVTRKAFITKMTLERIKSIPDPVVGIYRLTMKADSDNFRESAVQDIMRALKAAGVRILVYEPTLLNDFFNGFEVENNFDSFCQKASVILANREDEMLSQYSDKVLTRDIYKRN